MQAYAKESAQYLHELKAQDPELCTLVAAKSRGISPPPEAREKVFAADARANAISLRYAVAGRKSPTAHAAPTDADALAMKAAAEGLGASSQDMADMANLAGIPRERLCSTAVLLADAIAAMERTALGRVIASNRRKRPASS